VSGLGFRRRESVLGSSRLLARYPRIADAENRNDGRSDEKPVAPDACVKSSGLDEPDDRRRFEPHRDRGVCEREKVVGTVETEIVLRAPAGRKACGAVRVSFGRGLREQDVETAQGARRYLQ
jgi:hypothetical protein